MTEGNKAKSMKAVITLKIHQHKLETLEKEMRKYQSLLESGLLVNVWYVATF